MSYLEEDLNAAEALVEQLRYHIRKLEAELSATQQQRDELLAACEAAKETWNDNAPGHGMTPRKCIDLMQAAIDKARGE